MKLALNSEKMRISAGRPLGGLKEVPEEDEDKLFTGRFRTQRGYDVGGSNFSYRGCGLYLQVSSLFEE